MRINKPVMADLLKSPISLLHIGFGLVALLAGTLVLLMPKGTPRHRQVGYVYVASMLVVLTTAFGIYHLFGRFGIVHWGAVGSWLALLAGMGAAWGRARLLNWLTWHYLGLSASVTSLYATFLVESTYRLFPARFFWWTTVGTSGIVFLVAACLIYWRGQVSGVRLQVIALRKSIKC